MRSISLDEAQLATLTPEEQAAIADGDDSEGGSAASTNDDDLDDGADDGDDSDEVLDANGQPVEGAPEAKSTPQPETPEPKDEPPAQDEPAPAPTRNEYLAKLPEDFEQKITDLATQEAEIRAKFKTGDIELDEYELQRDAILKERESLNTSKLKAEISQEMRDQAVQNEWQNQISTFMAAAAKSDGLDYRKDAEKASDLDDFVKKLANNPIHADKSGDWFLTEAHKRVMALHGLSKAPAATETPTPKTPSRESPLKNAPKTLAQVPGGDGPGDVSDEFADIDALTGTAQEDAIAKMTPAARNKYLGL